MDVQTRRARYCHAPKTVADKHYTKAPQELLDDAVAWLGKQYQTTPEKPAKSKPGKD